MKKDFRIGVFKEWNTIQASFSFTEKVLFYVLVIILIGSTLGLLATLNNNLLTEVPAPGGRITEGVVGAPRFINPILALSDADRDLTTLTYAGLMRAQPDGTLIPDLAKSFTISNNGLVYTFVLKEDAQFHDGKPVTADDVVYTIGLAQNADVKSPKRANWEGVRVEALNDQTIQFTLAQTYAPFLENTTMGILPKHRWENVPPDQILVSTYNTEPIGSGPFQVVDIQRDGAGVPTKYTLNRFDKYTLGTPYLESIDVRFYPNEEELIRAFNRGVVENIHSISPDQLDTLEGNDYIVHTAALPRVFGVFFNQDNASFLISQSVREALSISVDRNKIVEEVLNGYGEVANGPLPPTLTESLFGTLTETPDIHGPDPDGAIALLEAAGWEKNEESGIMTKEIDDVETELHFSMATSNAPELKKVAEILQSEWKQIGIAVDLNFYETSDLNQQIIRPREYQALLFGQIIGRDLDPFAFWHSSQRDDPGLNIALYANIDADAALEKIRTTFEKEDLATYYEKFEKEIAADAPAVFLYTPEFIYITSNKLKGVQRGTIATPAERFLDVHAWHIFTQKVWPMFVQS